VLAYALWKALAHMLHAAGVKTRIRKKNPEDPGAGRQGPGRPLWRGRNYGEYRALLVLNFSSNLSKREGNGLPFVIARIEANISDVETWKAVFLARYRCSSHARLAPRLSG